MATALFSLIAGAFMIAGGLVGVTIGLRRGLAAGLSMALVGELIATLSPNIAVFTWGGRVVMALGACLVTPAVLGLVAALYQGRQRAIAFGTIAGAAALSTLSPLALGAVMDQAGFRLTFAIMAAYFAIVLCCTRLVPATPPADRHARFDVAGTAVAALGLGLALLGVSHLSDWGILAPQKMCPFTVFGMAPTLPAIVAGLLLLGLLVPTERRAERRGNPLIPTVFVTSKGVRAGLAAVFVPFFYMGAVGILATPYLQLVTGFTALQTGLLSLLSGIPMFLLATFLPKLAPHLSSRFIIRAFCSPWPAASLPSPSRAACSTTSWPQPPTGPPPSWPTMPSTSSPPSGARARTRPPSSWRRSRPRNPMPCASLSAPSAAWCSSVC